MTDDYDVQPRYRRSVDALSRREHLDHFGEEYGAGQHLTMLSPTTGGKTELSHQQLAQVISPDFKANILSGKPPGRDSVMPHAVKRLNMRKVDEWPPPYSFRDHNRNGLVLEPRHTMVDFDADNANIRTHFKACMIDAYRSKKPNILVVDEGFHVQNEYKLRRELETPLMRGAPVVAVWTLCQRGRYMTYHIYDAAEWMFLFKDQDRKNRQRYSDFGGGVDPRFLMQVQDTLQTRVLTKPDGKKATISEAICVRRSGEIYIVKMD
jgi:hypothetical protein